MPDSLVTKLGLALQPSGEGYALRTAPSDLAAATPAWFVQEVATKGGATLPPVSIKAGISVAGLAETAVVARVTTGTVGASREGREATMPDTGPSRLVVRPWYLRGSVWCAGAPVLLDFGTVGATALLHSLPTYGAARMYVQILERSIGAILAVDVGLTPYETSGGSTPGAPVASSDITALAEVAAYTTAASLTTPIYSRPSDDTATLISALIAGEAAGLNRTSVLDVLRAVYSAMIADAHPYTWVNPLAPYVPGWTDFDDLTESAITSVAPHLYLPNHLESHKTTEAAGLNRSAVISALDAQIAVVAPATVASPQGEINGYSQAVACAIAMQAVNTNAPGGSPNNNSGYASARVLLQDELDNAARGPVLACLRAALGRRWSRDDVRLWS